MTKAFWAVTIMTVLGAGSSRAASFDCAKAVGKTEKLICSNSTLSKADELMAAAYHKAMAAPNQTATERDDLKQDQLNWIKERVAECAGRPMLFGDPAPRGVPCIAGQYKLRTAALELYAAQAAHASSEPVSPTGTFEIFGTCVSCGGGTVDFIARPDGKVSFSLSVNNGKDTGDESGDLVLKNNTATYKDSDNDCTLAFAFTHATVKIDQKGECGFGFNVHADGYYLKTSNAVPKLSDQ
jgi:uncharacterized protein YecT (DUF1311 family)